MSIAAVRIPDTPRPTIDAGAFYDPASPTCGINEAVQALPPSGGRVRIPAGTYVLTQSVYVKSRVSLVGEGPATVLTIRLLKTDFLAKNARAGLRTLTFRRKPPFREGQAIGFTDARMIGWWGTHGIVEKVDGSRLTLDVPVNRALSVERKARAVSLFPAITAKQETDLEIADLTLQGPPDYEGPWWDFTYTGIHIDGCNRVRIRQCTVSGWPSDGIGVQRGSDVQVTQCQAHGCRGHGFHPGTGLGRSVWSHNIARGNGADGYFFCARVHHTVCSDSVFAENARHGIGGAGDAGDHHNVISSNVCACNGRAGIDGTRGTEQVMSGNVLLSNSREEPGRWPGIRLDDLTNSIIQGNRCADDQKRPTQTRGIVESGTSDRNLITGNMCIGMKEGIVVVGQGSRVEGNLV